ncbi:hypothetical protein BG011_001280 [Mortierella polycephala]|uniref:Uncharacterized protein n=1 Tax=Mortierella polycephala TaxID=41804 RepID=A0A9P6U6B8_9FUNG|nr:hypothetical protein BG011_001280 [Mortierella polycephala]
MPHINPFEVPEIRTLIGHHLDRSSQVKCMQISTAWHATMLPLIWSTINLNGTQPLHNPSPDALERMCYFVKDLQVIRLPSQEYATLDYPNLRTLDIMHWISTSDSLDPPICNRESAVTMASLTRLTLSAIEIKDSNRFWGAIARLPSLKQLGINWMTLSLPFWKACSKVEVLLLGFVTVLEYPQDDGMTFPRITKLALSLDPDSVFSVQEQLAFMSRCPLLESLLWCPKDRRPTLPSHVFEKQVSVGQWPRLEELVLHLPSFSDRDIAFILGAMNRVIVSGNMQTNFGQLSFKALRFHFSTLRELDLYASDGATSEMFAEVLASCPGLQKLLGNVVYAKDLVQSPPWVCLSLRTFGLTIRLDIFDIVTIMEVGLASGSRSLTVSSDELQRLVFGRLAGLKQLEVLNMSDRELPFEQRALSLQLDNGLELLEDLKDLREIHFMGTEQMMMEEDVVWMLEHWKKLEVVSGYLNADVQTEEDFLSDLLRRGGVQHMTEK